MNKTGPYFALLSAVLFGASTPLAKTLLANVSPVLLAGLLYLGAGAGLGISLIVRRLRSKPITEGKLNRSDYLWLAAAVLFGGVLGPLLLMLGLALTSAANASLLLNLEAVLTSVIAWTFFREHFNSRIIIGMVVIVIGAAMITLEGIPQAEGGLGELLILIACLSWALDNNVTRKVSGGDPQVIVCIKGFTAGTVNTIIGFYLGASLPTLGVLTGVAVVGFLCYGPSLQLFILGLRYIGTARTGAYFSVAPFVGAALSLIIFPRLPSPLFWFAAVLMGIGVWLHLTETHDHEHVHEPMLHDHRHIHDEHHQHDHEGNADPHLPHSHSHHHPHIKHKHPHFPDIHHRHEHWESHSRDKSL